ncbi:EthD domain-containing protein [Sphingomonas faeni]|uniref:EthD domain-containing protein n=1 Tax=Sphingomonas faeni TaxID=185950 RepID=UPI00334FCFBA
MRDGLPRDMAYHYWRDVHSTLCSRLPGLGFYVQQHFDRDRTAHLWPAADGVRPMTAMLDGAAELGFASVEDQAVFGEASKVLYADERNLFSEAVAYFLPTGSITFVDREEDGIRNGPDRYHRVHVFMNRRPGPDATQWVQDTSADLAAHAAVQKWKLHLGMPYDNANPAPPSPDVNHFVEDDRLNVAVAEVAFENARTAREFFAGSAFQMVLARQADHIDALGARLVTGFYTFVRDGKPTTAGIRGSRPAQLIDGIGAINQVTPEIAARFVRQ